MPFIGKFPKFRESKFQQLSKQFCKEGANIKIDFSTFKLALLVSTKEKVRCGLMFYIIYKFLCAGCNTDYVGETSRHISSKTHEHLETDKNSNIYLHFRKSNT